MNNDFNSLYLEHHGIKGQKWGVRRYQKKDGTLTRAGKRRYFIDKNTGLTKVGKERKAFKRLKEDLQRDEARYDRFVQLAMGEIGRKTLDEVRSDYRIWRLPDTLNTIQIADINKKKSKANLGKVELPDSSNDIKEEKQE